MDNDLKTLVVRLPIRFTIPLTNTTRFYLHSINPCYNASVGTAIGARVESICSCKVGSRVDD